MHSRPKEVVVSKRQRGREDRRQQPERERERVRRLDRRLRDALVDLLVARGRHLVAQQEVDHQQRGAARERHGDRDPPPAQLPRPLEVRRRPVPASMFRTPEVWPTGFASSSSGGSIHATR